MNRIKAILKQTIPIGLLRFFIGFFYGWRGNYRSWEEAGSECTGYGTDIILEKVKNSLLKVKNGTAVYERDSVIFDKVQHSFPLISAIMWIALQKSGKINVLDFGGSLGSTYYQNRMFLSSLSEYKWCIVEQPKFVQTGNELFANDHMKFYDSIDNCMNSNKIDVVLFSSVLQYLDKPYEVLQTVFNKGIEYIIIDRTHFISNKSIDRITIQKVPEKIYKAKYPCRFFDETKFLDFFKEKYNLIFEFNVDEFMNIRSDTKGFFFKKK